MKVTSHERDAVLAYLNAQVGDDPVVHLDKIAVERVGAAVHDIWDVHCRDSRWWAVSNPLNLYPHEDFKSRDLVLTFHVGLARRVANRAPIPITGTAAALLPTAWRMWEQAVEAMTTGREAEDFRAVGVRLRECLVSYAAEIADDDFVPEGTELPKDADVVGWTNLLAQRLAAGSASAPLRSYVKKLARETWDYVNKLTHAKKAGSYDAEIGAAAVSHFLSTVTAVRMRWAAVDHQRCAACGSYRVPSGTCVQCGWTDPDYQDPPRRELSEEDRAVRLGEPFTPSSDIATFISPKDP